MDATISTSTVTGTARAPPSSEYTHRAVFAGGYSSGVRINDARRDARTAASMTAVDAFGGEVTEDGTVLDIVGFEGPPDVPPDVLDCAGSATTLRFAAAAGALADGLTVLTGDRSLRDRRRGPLLDAIAQLGGRAESTRSDGRAPLVVGGPVDGGRLTVPDDVPPDLVSPFLMAGGLTPDGVRIAGGRPVESRAGVEVTLDVLGEFGITVRESGDALTVPGNQFYEPTEAEYSVPGDFGAMAPLLAAGALAAEGELHVQGAFPSARPETGLVDILDAMGGDVDWDRDDGRLTVRRASLDGVVTDVGAAPDLLPAVAALASVADGTTRIENAGAERYETGDRTRALVAELSEFGVEAHEEGDALVVEGAGSELTGATVDGRSDGHLVMALAALGLVADGETTVRNAEHATDVFPGFFGVLYDLGATVQW